MQVPASDAEPDGQNANWSVKERTRGVMKCWVYVISDHIRSMTRVRTGVMDIGRKSECVFGNGILLTGQIET